MTPAFSSWQSFFAMGGYAFYVWLAVGVTLFSLGVLLVFTLWQGKHVRSTIYHRSQHVARRPVTRVVSDVIDTPDAGDTR